MKKLASLVLLSVLAACTTVPPETDQQGAAPGAPAADVASQPLQVPALAQLPETPARTLAGKFVAVDWSTLPGWNEDNLEQVWKAFLNNCKGLMRPVSGSLVMPARAAPRAWQPVCAAASQWQDRPAPSAAAMREFLQTRLRPWRVLDAQGKLASNTVTGYYEPIIQGSKRREGVYQWPLYAPPTDLLTVDLGTVYPELAGKRIRGKLQGKRVVPYDTRAQIAASNNPPPVLVWAADPVEAFFLQIQGSGRVRLPDGSMLRLAYADHNGRPYASIGKWLADKGELPLSQASMQNIKAWAQRNPARVQEMLNANPAMVFFSEEAIVDPELGPKGAYGIPLIGQRSVAVDAGFVPLGSPIYLATTHPSSNAPLRRLMFAQDTGAAIKGAARTDFYWGSGDQAGEQAGRMKQNGQMWVLWPRQAGAPTAR